MKAGFPPFGNSVVQLRLLEEQDLPHTLAWRNRDDARIWFKNSDIVTPEQHQAWFAAYTQKEDDFVFIIESRRQSFGQAAVYGIDHERGVAEVGRFLVAPDAGGRGLMTLACAELVRFCAGTLKLNSLFLEVKAENQRAIRMYQRNGFEEELRADGLIRMNRSLGRDLGRSAHAGDVAPV
jgi:diamine N-acetyltransferase